MRTIKASLKINKNGRLFCTVHNTYKVSKLPVTNCKICWEIFDKSITQPFLDAAINDLEQELKFRKARHESR